MMIVATMPIGSDQPRSQTGMAVSHVLKTLLRLITRN